MAAKTSSPTVTLKHLAANIAEEHELAKKQAEAILGNMVELVVKHLKKGDRIRIGGLGILLVRRLAESCRYSRLEGCNVLEIRLNRQIETQRGVPCH